MGWKMPNAGILVKPSNIQPCESILCEAFSQLWPLCMDAMTECMCELICLVRDCQSVSVYVLTCVDTTTDLSLQASNM